MNTLIVLLIISSIICTLSDEQGDDEPDDKKIPFIGHSLGFNDAFNKLFEKFRANKGNLDQLFNKNPDIKRSMAELIVSRGFQSEEHTVVTDDGYILGIFRIINPYIRPKDRLKPVLLWHQINCNSGMWLVSSPGFLDTNGRYSEGNGSLTNNCRDKLTSNVPFTLAACGYDVWLGNTRGNLYSPGHMYLPSRGIAFSNYTFTEMGVYDLKNTVEFILRKTNSHCVGYFGSSMGSTQMFALLSMIPSFERYMNPIITGPTVTFLGNATSTVRFATPLVPLLNNVVLSVGMPLIMGQAMSQICRHPLIRELCAYNYRAGGLLNPPSYLSDADTLNLLYTFTSGNYLSSKIILQYGQFFLNGRFNQFDYMKPELNYQAYGQPTAPDYPLHKISSKNLVLLWSKNDIFVSKYDFDHLLSSLTVRPLDVYVVKNPTYSHFDYIFSKYNNKYIMGRILGHLSGQMYKLPDD